MRSSIVIVGSLNTDFVIRVDRFPLPGETLMAQDLMTYPGGKGANQAYAAARLGASVAMIGQVGNDAQAAWLRDNLAQVGVDVSQVRQDLAVSSGVATITIDGTGQNQIIIVPGANGSFLPERLRASEGTLATAGYVLLQLEIPLPTVVLAAQMAKNAGAVVILDPAPAQSLPDELLSMADYVTPNETELALLTNRAPAAFDLAQTTALARILLDRGARKVIAKMGARGALLVARDHEHFWPAIPVDAVDTTAAGDAFNAGFAAALARGANDVQAGSYAVAAAACSVRRAGAQPSMPTHEEVQKLLGSSIQ